MKKLIYPVLIALGLITASAHAEYFDSKGRLIESLTSTATAGSTTTLTYISSKHQRFTGSSAQTLSLPSGTSLRVGTPYVVENDSTGVVTVRNNGGTSLAAVPAGATWTFLLTANGTSNGTWTIKRPIDTGLTSAHILVGNSSGLATDVAVSGDLTMANTGAGTVATVGGSTAANVHSAELAANAATSANTVSTIVKRDGSGNFSAGTITGTFSGTATNATNGATVSTTTNASYFPLFAASSSNGNQPFNLGTGLTFNPSSNVLTTTTFVGALTGTASGNLTYTPTNHGVVVSGSGNAASVTAAGTSGQVLTSNGASADPTYQDVSALAGVPTQPYESDNLGASAAISSNTLVVSLKQSDGSSDPAASPSNVKVSFRGTTVTNGNYSSASFTAANSITLAATDSIGASSGVATPLNVYLVSDTTSEICLSMSFFSDSTLNSASALTGGADTDYSKMWCTNAHTSKPTRFIGRVTATWSNPNWGTLAAVAVGPRLRQFDDQIITTTGAGMGSTNTRIRRIETAHTSVGTAITQTNSATAGTSFTINEEGLYNIVYCDCGPTSNDFGISLNSAQLTTSILSLTASTILGTTTSPSSCVSQCVPVVRRLHPGDVVRPHTDATFTNTTLAVRFSITRIGE